jgi:phosphomannomutase
MAPPSIRFGTAGWRALIARDFTFANVRLASQAVADYLKAGLADPASGIHGRDPRVIIAYDCRFLGRPFALAVAEVFAANGLIPLAVRARHADARFVLRHSAAQSHRRHQHHRQPQSAGILRLQILAARRRRRAARSDRPIEETIARLQRENWNFPRAIGTFSCKSIDPQAEYFRRIRKLADFSAIKKARLKVAVDVMHGCGRGYLDTLLREAGRAPDGFARRFEPALWRTSARTERRTPRRIAQVRPRRPRAPGPGHRRRRRPLSAWSIPTARGSRPTRCWR